MRQFIDLFLPKPDVTSPLALFIHGGYWRSLEPALFSQAARGLNGHGVAVAVVGYDLCPQVTIPEIIDQIRQACLFLWLRSGRPMMVFGHSAGGHLAAAMLATDWQALYPKARAALVPTAYSISGLFDLTPLLHVSMAADLRLNEADARDPSPLFWPAPRGRVFDAVVGALEFRRGRARAGSSQRRGQRPACKRVMRTLPAPTISPCSITCAIRKAQWCGGLLQLARAEVQVTGYAPWRFCPREWMSAGAHLCPPSPSGRDSPKKMPGCRSGRAPESAREYRGCPRRCSRSPDCTERA